MSPVLRARPCSDGSIDVGEPLLPQAPAASGWVLLEHRGPWDAHPGAESPLVPAALRAAVQERNLRLNLIRRHRQRPGGRPTTCFLASGRPGGPFVERLRLCDPGDLIGAPLDALAAGRPSGAGSLITRPLYLVCTHGRRDACCARLGRPIAQAVTALAGARAWETTHVGGCRFAANLVCLPSGAYYGRVTPQDVATVVSLTEAGRIALPWFRGRIGAGGHAQFAEAFLRRLTGLDVIDAVRPAGGCRPSADDPRLHEVDLASGTRRYRLLLRDGAPESRRLTCAGDLVETSGPIQVVSMVELGA